MQIRRFESTDLSAVHNLHNLALQATGAHMGPGAWDEDLQRIGDVYLRESGEFLVGECDGQLVAMGALKRSCSRRAEVKRMRVHPQYQRRGFGRRMLVELEARAAKLGYRQLHLDTTDLQFAAARMYVEHGYTQVREEPRTEFKVLYFEKVLGGVVPISA